MNVPSSLRWRGLLTVKSFLLRHPAQDFKDAFSWNDQRLSGLVAEEPGAKQYDAGELTIFEERRTFRQTVINFNKT